MALLISGLERAREVGLDYERGPGLSMSFNDALLVITGGLSISLIVVLIQAYKHLHALNCEKHSLEAQSAELHAQLEREAENYKDALNRVRAYYDEHVNRKKNEVPKSDALHERGELDFKELVEEMERKAAREIPPLRMNGGTLIEMDFSEP